jgi:protein TonB
MRRLDEPPLPPLNEPPPPLPMLPRVPISGGILNGKAISKPQPPYPSRARAARAAGMVTVQVTVDESGKVSYAEALDGHPLLRQASEEAAYRARFAPTRLSGQPVAVSGVISYNFVLP